MSRISSSPRGRAALVDHARAECPGLDQVQRDVFGNRRQERRATADDDRIAEHAQLADEAELDRRRGQAGAADRDILVSRVERRSGLPATDASASRALPSTLSSVRLKTNFGSAHQTSANAASARWKRNSSSLGSVHPNPPCRSAMKPSAETLIE